VNAYRWALRVAGALMLAIGLGHTVMPTLGYPDAVPAAMEPATRDHFYYLGTYAIGAFLLGFAALTFAHSRRPPAPVFAVIMAAVWTVRLVLEVVYPVDIQIFALERPTTVITPVLGAIVAAFAVAAASSLRTNRSDA
jgi:hypothetical protein